MGRWMLMLVLILAGCLSSAGASGGDDGAELDLSRLERLVHGAVNEVRIEHGLPAIAWNDTLSFIAAAHSADMAANDFFGHEGSEDRKSTRLNSSHVAISYAVFCLRKETV